MENMRLTVRDCLIWHNFKEDDTLMFISHCIGAFLRNLNPPLSVPVKLIEYVAPWHWTDESFISGHMTESGAVEYFGVCYEACDCAALLLLCCSLTTSPLKLWTDAGACLLSAQQVPNDSWLQAMLSFRQMHALYLTQMSWCDFNPAGISCRWLLAVCCERPLIN